MTAATPHPGTGAERPRYPLPAIVLLVLAGIAIALIGAHVSDDSSSVPATSARGSGAVVTERREVPAFSAVELAGANNVTVRVGSPQSVAVHAQAQPDRSRRHRGARRHARHRQPRHVHGDGADERRRDGSDALHRRAHRHRFRERRRLRGRDARDPRSRIGHGHRERLRRAARRRRRRRGGRRAGRPRRARRHGRARRHRRAPRSRHPLSRRDRLRHRRDLLRRASAQRDARASRAPARSQPE